MVHNNVKLCIKPPNMIITFILTLITTGEGCRLYLLVLYVSQLSDLNDYSLKILMCMSENPCTNL